MLGIQCQFRLCVLSLHLDFFVVAPIGQISSLFLFLLDEMLAQHEYDNLSSQKSCYSSDTNATVSVLQRFLTPATSIVPSSRTQNSSPDIRVEPCTREFLGKHFHDVSTNRNGIH